MVLTLNKRVRGVTIHCLLLVSCCCALQRPASAAPLRGLKAVSTEAAPPIEIGEMILIQ